MAPDKTVQQSVGKRYGKISLLPVQLFPSRFEIGSQWRMIIVRHPCFKIALFAHKVAFQRDTFSKTFDGNVRFSDGVSWPLRVAKCYVKMTL
jgi:hypothetical protein